MRSTARSVMRLESSWMVMTSGMITSRMTLSRGCWMPACLSFSRSRLRRSDASERWRCASSKALLIVSLPRSRRSSPTRAGLLVTLAPFFLLRLSSSPSPGSMSSLRLPTGSVRRSSVLGLSAEGTTTTGPFGGGGFLTTIGSGAAGASADTAAASTSSGGVGSSASSRARCTSRRAASRASASARSLAISRARRRASISSVESPPGSSWAAACSSSGRDVPASSASPVLEIVRFFFFSTTTDFDRPWLKLCRTWPASTVRFKLNGLRGVTDSVLSVVSLVSVMHVLCLLQLPV